METVDEELPWETASAFTLLLPQIRDSLASYYRPDIWHLVNMGVGKSWIANCLVLMLHLFDGTSVVQRLESMSAAYSSFCSNSDPWNVIGSPYFW